MHLGRNEGGGGRIWGAEKACFTTGTQSHREENAGVVSGHSFSRGTRNPSEAVSFACARYRESREPQLRGAVRSIVAIDAIKGLRHPNLQHHQAERESRADQARYPPPAHNGALLLQD